MRSHLAAGAAAACLLLAGCASTVALQPAPDATSPACAGVIVGVRGIAAIAAAERRNTDAQGTAAWGTPAAITLTCGVDTPQVSDLRCATYDGVDWLYDDRGTTQVLTTYGREPGVQVIVTSAASTSDAVMALSDPIASATRATKRVCLSDPGSPPSASPSVSPTP